MEKHILIKGHKDTNVTNVKNTFQCSLEKVTYSGFLHYVNQSILYTLEKKLSESGRSKS